MAGGNLEAQPLIEARGAFLAGRAGLDANALGDAFDYVAQALWFRSDEARQPNAVARGIARCFGVVWTRLGRGLAHD
jgi:hypothetical protein